MQGAAFTSMYLSCTRLMHTYVHMTLSIKIYSSENLLYFESRFGVNEQTILVYKRDSQMQGVVVSLFEQVIVDRPVFFSSTFLLAKYHKVFH